jgi:Holliday junction resolvase RusA-like endonuclease
MTMSNVTSLPAKQLHVWVPGTPVTQGSKTIASRAGKVWMREARGESLEAWRDTIAWHVVRELHGREFSASDDAVSIEATFWLPRPLSTRRKHPNTQRDGDLDKYLRAVGDALTRSGVIHDDAQIVSWSASKHWASFPAEAGVLLTISTINDQEREKAA